MADAKGNNSRLLPDSPFGQTFPLDGAPIGGLGTTGLFEPVNIDAGGNLLVAGNFTASIGTVSIGAVSITGSLPAGTNAIGTVSIAGTTAVNLTEVNGTAVALGQATMAASIPVAIASNQSAIPITGTIDASNPSVSTTNAAVPAQATLLGIDVGGNIQPWAGTAVVNGTAFAGRIDMSSVNGALISLGQATMAASLPVAIASNQSALPITGTASVSGTVSVGNTVTVAGTVSANQLGTWIVNLTELNGTALTIGQQHMTASMPVVLAVDQSALTAVISGTAVVSGTVSANQLGTWIVNLTEINGTALTIGQQHMTASIPVVIASDQSSVSVNGTVSIANTLSINTAAVNISQFGGTAVSLGQKVMATSMPVVIASDQSPIPISGSITASNPSVSTTNATTPAQATLLGLNVGGNMQPWAGTAVVNATAYAGRVDLDSVNGALLSLGQATMAASIPVAIASNQSAIPITGSITASNPSVSTTNATAPVQATLIGVNVGGNLQNWAGLAVVNATAYAGRVDLSSLNGTALSIGQQHMTASVPVAIAVDQSALTAVISGTTVVSGTVSANQIGTWAINLTQIGGTALAIGQQHMTASIPVVIASDQSNLTTVIGAAIPAGTNAIGTVSVTGTPGINLAQVGATAITLGQKVMATSIPVVVASDQTPIPTGLSTSLMLRGATTSATTSARTIIAAQTGTAIYVTGLQFSNTSGTTVIATLNDSQSSVFIVPAGGGNNVPGLGIVPLRVGTGTALTFTLSTGVSTVYANAQAYGNP